MKPWTMADLEKNDPKPAGKKSAKLPKKVPAGVQHIKNILTLLKADFVQEHRFHHVRRFRFDFAIPAKMIAIEYEGLNSAKSGHLTFGGYTENCTKYNMATALGWRVLRYTMKNYEQVYDDLKQMIP